MHTISLHVCLYLLAVLSYTLFDVVGFPLVKNNKTILIIYRIFQAIFEIAIDAALILNGFWASALAFEVCHFGMGCDGLYYALRGEDYLGYTITWFSTSIPSIVFRAMKKPFTGKDLFWIWKVAVIAGLLIAIVFA